MPRREVFEWGFQKNSHKTKELVTSFVTNDELQDNSDSSKNEQKNELYMSDSLNASKALTTVNI